MLEATIALLIERGYAGLTVDDVSSYSGLTNGARAHHFATKLDLIVETFKYLYHPVIESSRESAAAARNDPDPIGAFFHHSARIFLIPQAVAFNELMMGARTDVALRERILPLIDMQHQDVHLPWIEMLTERGYPRELVEKMMIATMFFFRGVATDPLTDTSSPDVQTLIGFWREQVTNGVQTSPSAALNG